MKFILTYDGELRSNGKAIQKWGIRNHLSPQMKELWEIHPSLQNLAANRFVPKSRFQLMGTHHTERVEPLPNGEAIAGQIDLIEPISLKDRQFIPLVRSSMRLQCALKVLFLRKESPGKVYQGGDLDNRLKTLFDSLSVPTPDQVQDDGQTDPIHCLLEDDSLITRIDVDTQRLLSRPGANHHDVRLVIEVDVRVSTAEPYNYLFLGD